ncbi:MAG: hypothetical protein LQ337_004975 [Flavoplaca oasis]|nr:MAG: hypothetical protein LQ337_004975 [Flavoplaca oasis]
MAGSTALCYACKLVDSSMVKALLKHGANPNWHMNLVADSMPLHVAVDADLSKLGVHHLKLRAVVEALHEEGADPSIPDADGRLVEDKTSNSELKEILPAPQFGRISLKDQ